MRVSYSILLTAALSCLSPVTAAPAGGPRGPEIVQSTYDAIVQAGYKTAYLLDSKDYEALGEVMTDDVVYDSTALGAYGGKAVGLDQVKSAVEHAFGGAYVEHLVTNLYIKEFRKTEARVITYITYSHWNENALKDITKTFRIWYKCDDLWVLQDGAWKMKTSLVENMGPKPELPYFG